MIPLYSKFSRTAQALRNILDRPSFKSSPDSIVQEGLGENWVSNHRDTIQKLLAKLPSGSGFDTGTKYDEDHEANATPASGFTLFADFHAMNSNGMYVGWFTYEIRVRPAFDGIDLDVNAQPDFIGEEPARDDLDPETTEDDLRVFPDLDYVHEVFSEALKQPVEDR